MHGEALEAGAPAAAGHLQRVEDHLGAHVRGDAPADDHPAEGVDDETRVSGPGPGGHHGQIAHPQPIRGLGGEVASDEIAGPGLSGAGAGAALPPLAGRAAQAGGAHQPRRLVSADLMAGPARRQPQLARPIHPEIRPPQLLERRGHRRVAARPRRRGPGLGAVVGRRGDRQLTPDRLDPELFAVSVDERDHHRRGRSSSAAKKAEAALKIASTGAQLPVLLHPTPSSGPGPGCRALL